MATTLPAAQTRQSQERGRPLPPSAVKAELITGGFRQIKVVHLAMAWWLHASGHMTRRQLRLYFAAHELAERRRHTNPVTGPERPLYTLDEIKHLVGGRGSVRADRDLRADLKALAALGLVIVTRHRITFATSPEQLKIEDLSGFWAMMENIAYRARTVPVPRRMIRALAAGFSRGVTAVIIATLIRSLFWYKPDGEEQGGYRVDGRTKKTWIADTFGLSVRAVASARAHLVELGWLIPLDAPTWLINRYGAHHAIDPTWKPMRDGESAPLEAANDAGSAPPDQTDRSSLREDFDTRRPAPLRAGPTGVSKARMGKTRSVQRRSQAPTKPGAVSIRNIRPEDLGNTNRLLELHRQATAASLCSGSEAGRLDFIALAERARARAERPEAMFFWLLSRRKYDFITQADEDAAARRLREHRNGRRGSREEEGRGAPREAWLLCDDDRFVLACLRIARERRQEPHQLARQAKGWTIEQWETARAACHARDVDRWRSSPEQGGDHDE